VPADAAPIAALDLDEADFKAAVEEWDACTEGGEDVDGEGGNGLN
jgi:hypothetical protein